MQNLGLFVANCVSTERDWRLHRSQADELHDVIGNHVTQGAGCIVVAAAGFDPDGFSYGDLHMIDVAAVPNWLEDSIGKPERQNVLDSFFTQIVINTIDL